MGLCGHFLCRLQKGWLFKVDIAGWIWLVDSSDESAPSVGLGGYIIGGGVWTKVFAYVAVYWEIDPCRMPFISDHTEMFPIFLGLHVTTHRSQKSSYGLLGPPTPQKSHRYNPSWRFFSSPSEKLRSLAWTWTTTLGSMPPALTPAAQMPAAARRRSAVFWWIPLGNWWNPLGNHWGTIGELWNYPLAGVIIAVENLGTSNGGFSGWENHRTKLGSVQSCATFWSSESNWTFYWGLTWTHRSPSLLLTEFTCCWYSYIQHIPHYFTFWCSVTLPRPAQMPFWSNVPTMPCSSLRSASGSPRHPNGWCLRQTPRWPRPRGTPGGPPGGWWLAMTNAITLW